MDRRLTLCCGLGLLIFALAPAGDRRPASPTAQRPLADAGPPRRATPPAPRHDPVLRRQLEDVALARIAASTREVGADLSGLPVADPYRWSRLRDWATLDNQRRLSLVHGSAEQELASARAFASVGLYREALAHYRVLEVAFGRPLPAEVARAAAGTVLGRLTGARTPIWRDADDQLLAVLDDRPSALELAVEESDLEAACRACFAPALRRVEPRGELKRVGHLDPSGVTRHPDSARDYDSIMLATGGPRRGPIGRGAACFAIDGSSLQASELLYKRYALGQLADSDPPRDAAGWELLSRAWLYLGERGRAAAARRQGGLGDWTLGELVLLSVREPQRERRRGALANAIEFDLRADREGPTRFTPSASERRGPLAGLDGWALQRVAAQAQHPLRQDAALELARRQQPAAKLRIDALATQGQLPLHVRARRWPKVEVSIHPVSEPLPEPAELARWVERRASIAPRDAAVERRALTTPDGDSQHRVPLPGPGVWQLVFQLPEGPASALVCSLDAAWVGAIRKVEVPRGAQLLLPPGTRGARRHGADEVEAIEPSGPLTPVGRGAIELVGPGQFGRLRIGAPSLPSQPDAAQLLVTTDRPLYQAGETIQLRGVLRRPLGGDPRTQAERWGPGANTEIHLELRLGSEVVASLTRRTNARGVFVGRVELSSELARGSYTLHVACEDVEARRRIAIWDYTRPRHVVRLRPAAEGGVHVISGRASGGAEPGSKLVITVDDQPAELRDGLVAARPGQRVVARLLARDGRELAAGTLTLPRPEPEPVAESGPAEPPRTTKARRAPAADDAPAPQPPKLEHLRLRASQRSYGLGETIELKLQAPYPRGQVLVLLADQAIYDAAVVELEDGRATVRFPARGIHDPGVTAYAIGRRLRTQLPISVRTRKLPIAIEAPRRVRPGQPVELELRSRPDTALELAVVDERIFDLRADDTPSVYQHYYPARQARLRTSRPRVSWSGWRVHRERPLPGVIEHDKLLALLAHDAEWWSLEWTRNRVAGAFGARGGGGGAVVESTVLRGLVFLQDAQRADGSWPTEPGGLDAAGQTGYAMLAYLGAGHTHRYGRHKDVIKRALRFLMKRQREDGALSPSQASHNLAALALAEAYGMTKSPLIKDAARRAVAHTLACRGKGGLWSDQRADIFGMMAIKSARAAEIKLDGSAAAWQALERQAERWNQAAMVGSDDERQLRSVSAACTTFVFVGCKRNDPRLRAAGAWIGEQAVPLGDGLTTWLASLAMFQLGGDPWKGWNKQLKAALADSADEDGAYRLHDRTVEFTCQTLLTLEIYYRYARVFGGSAGGAITRKAPRLRVHFPDTVLWLPMVVTDAEGKARLTFRAPDQTGELRITARGVDRAGAGQARRWITSDLPLQVELVRPPLLVAGDEVELVGYVSSQRARGVAHVRLAGQTVRRVHVSPSKPARLSWRVKVPRDVRKLPLRLEASLGELQDAVAHTVRIAPPGRRTREHLKLRLRLGRGGSFRVPAGCEAVELAITPTGGKLAQIATALRYLTSYPYG